MIEDTREKSPATKNRLCGQFSFVTSDLKKLSSFLSFLISQYALWRGHSMQYFHIEILWIIILYIFIIIFIMYYIIIYYEYYINIINIIEISYLQSPFGVDES